MKINGVVIIGGIHHNTLGVIRSLGESGISSNTLQVLIICKDNNPKNILSTSKYVKDASISYIKTYDEVVPWLIKNATFAGQRVIICCADGAAEKVIKNRELLEGKYKTPSTLMDVSELMVKSRQGSIANECGLTIPKSQDYYTNQSIDWELFPCIIKPYKSVTGAGKADIKIVESKTDLVEAIKLLQAEKIQIQEYIDKDIEFQLIGCSLDAGKKIIIPGFTKLIRQPKNTNTGYLLYSPIERIDYDKDAVERFIRKIGYSGLFSVEFIRGKDGKDYFLEINMRNDGNAYCVESAGVNLPYIWAYYQTYGELPNIPMSFTESIYFIPDFNDLKLAMKTIGLFKWIKQFRQAESHSIYNKNDMEPFKYEFWRQFKRVLGVLKM